MVYNVYQSLESILQNVNNINFNSYQKMIDRLMNNGTNAD